MSGASVVTTEGGDCDTEEATDMAAVVAGPLIELAGAVDDVRFVDFFGPLAR
jgi:hypothetical protein